MSSAVSMIDASTVCCQSAIRPANGARACRRSSISVLYAPNLAEPLVRVVRRRAGTARRRVELPGMRVGVSGPGPRVLQDRGADRGGEVQADGRRAPDLGAGHDPVRLRVALEPVGQAEPLPGDPVEHLLTEVPERRVAQVVGERRGLDHVRIAAAERVEQVAVPLVADQPLGHRPPHLGDLQAVRQPVVHQQPGAARADHLGDAAEPGEER